jgi:AcrR family transcriptional regulator
LALRERIVRAAQEHFFACGFVSITTDEIAAGLGISKKTLYRHFRSKKELLESALGSRAREIRAGLTQITDDRSMDVPEKFRRSCYIHPLYGLDGEVMTEDFPVDHRHHRGVFWAWFIHFMADIPIFIMYVLNSV